MVAGDTPYASLDARTKSFLDRLWQLRHRHGFMKGKPGGIIVTSAMPPENTPLSPAMEHAISSIRCYMTTEGMEIVGWVGVM